MTGDGINDSPALKAADVGISLGTGADIAKETSDIVLLDNNFKTIVAAIEQGRVIFQNIRKVITFLISDSFSEMLLIVGSIIFNTPLAVLPLQILWINIINDGVPHFSLAFEKGDKSVMEEKPVKKNEKLLTKEMKAIIFGAGIFRDVLVFFMFYYLLNLHLDLAYVRTIIFTSLGLKSLLNIFSIRHFHKSIWQYNPFSNQYLLLGVASSLLFLVFGIYWPPLQKILSTISLDFHGWLLAAFMSFASLLVIEITKLLYIKKIIRY
jgi:Ca2+-transporting ATPase